MAIINKNLFYFSLLFVAVLCFALHGVKSVEISCNVNAENECVFDQDVTLDEKEDIKITNSDKVLESTTTIVMKAPLKMKVIPTVIFQKFTHLKSLTIKEVGLTTITSDRFVNAKTLTDLHIENNNIGNLKSNSFATAKNLQKLDLSENQITKIEEGAFEGLNELTTLNLNSNKVVNLDLTQFAKIPKLDYLVAAMMDFTFTGTFNSDEVAKIVALNSTVTRLDLSNNPIDSTDLWRRLSIFPNVETAYFTGAKITHVDHMDEFKKLLPHLTNLVMDENPFDSKWLMEAKTYFAKEGVKFTDL